MFISSHADNKVVQQYLYKYILMQWEKVMHMPISCLKSAWVRARSHPLEVRNEIRKIYEMSDKHDCGFIFQRVMNKVSINPCK